MKITSTITALDLKALTHNGMSLWITPGAQHPYWASQPSWHYDFRLANPEDFLEAAGFDELEGVEDDYAFELEIEI
jgi:hypothetical protein